MLAAMLAGLLSLMRNFQMGKIAGLELEYQATASLTEHRRLAISDQTHGT